MVLNALTRFGKTRGLEINVNLELTKDEKKNVMAVFLVMSMLAVFV